MSALDDLMLARSLLVLDHPFWGVLAIRLKLREEPLCPTAAVDGEVLVFNSDFISKLTPSERIAIEAHEVMHCAMGDIWRLDERDPFIWNMACDYVNNEVLVQAGFTLPEDALIDQAYKGMSKEQVYNILKQKISQVQGGKGDGSGKYADPGKCGGMFKPDNMSEKDRQQAETEWKTALAQAAQVSQGNLPADFCRMIKDDVLDPPLPWFVILRDMVEHTARNDYNWSQPNRRYLQQGIILPGLLSDELPEVVVAVDTSGSISGDVLNRFAAETSAILGSYKTHIHVMHCDARVHSHEEYNTEDLPIELHPQGGGGTNFQPVFDEVLKKGIAPACLVYLTDMYGTFPTDEPEYPVMWVSTTKDKQAPWGITIPMDI